MEVSELTTALGSLSRQYNDFALRSGLAGKAAEARLLIPAVSPGSIDINLLPDFVPLVATTGPLFVPLLDKFGLVVQFAKHIKSLLELFANKESRPTLSVADCDDAVNLVKPIAEHGGTQSISVYRDSSVTNILVTDTETARRIIEGATSRKKELQSLLPSPERRQRVAMTWKRMDRDKVTVKGRSPDKGLIEEIDAKSHAVLFTDELSYLKREMIADEDNPYQQVYFVDVEISRAAGGKVAAYRIVGYHGKDDL